MLALSQELRNFLGGHLTTGLTPDMAQVTRYRTDGRMIMGVKGSVTPFNPSQTNSSEAKSTSEPSSAQPDLIPPAAVAYENQGRE